MLLVYWAFRANYRTARAYEEVTVTATELTVRQVSHRGRVREWTLNPLWVKLDRIVHEEFGVERLFLVSRGRRLPIAAFLGPAEKASFAHALSARRSARRNGARRARCSTEAKDTSSSEIGWFGRPPTHTRSGANDGGIHAIARSRRRSDPERLL